MQQLADSPRADGLELWIDVTWSSLPSTWAIYTGAFAGLGHFPEIDPNGATNWSTGPMIGVDRVAGVQMLKDLGVTGADVIGSDLGGANVPLNQTLILRAEGMTWRGCGSSAFKIMENASAARKFWALAMLQTYLRQLYRRHALCCVGQ